MPDPIPSAATYAKALLRSLGVEGTVNGEADHPALAWRRSGLQDVTGFPDQQGLVAPVALPTAADGAMMALKTIAPDSTTLPCNGVILLGERSRLMQLTRRGDINPGGSCYLFDTKRGAVALNLARDDDWELLPAWLCVDEIKNVGQIANLIRAKDCAPLVERGRELGMALAADSFPEEQQKWISETRMAPPSNAKRCNRPLVVDLSTLWAGPLAASLLSFMGARVVKVESSTRPDGARRGNAAFYDLLNAGKECVDFDFSSESGMHSLASLIDQADIVIEGSRPRALRQLSIDAEQIIKQRPGKVWLSITGYGRDGDNGDWIGFGDDAAVAAGLTYLMEQAYSRKMFVGDAVADPLTGIHGALAAWAAYQTGGGVLLDLALRDVTAYAIWQDLKQIDLDSDKLKSRAREWSALAENDTTDLYPMRNVTGTARPHGGDTQNIISEFSLC